MLDWSQCPAIERTPANARGVFVFKNTRIPVIALFQNLNSGATIDNFLERFPGVTREQVHDVLDHAARSSAERHP
jgi:uncharacterized protein (DUF433 family)